MIAPKINFWEHLLINSLNSLQAVQSKLQKLTKSKINIHEDVNSAIQNIKIYLGTMTESQQNIDHLNEAVLNLKKQKEELNIRHHQILESLQMLVYQKDYKQLKQKINFYKERSLNDTLVSFSAPNEHDNSSENSHQTLNRAFLKDETQGNSENQFLNIGSKMEYQEFIEEIEKENISSALKVISCEREPFEKKEEAWLGIVYSKNGRQESDIFNSNQNLNSHSARTQRPSQIIMTEEFDSKSKKKLKDLTCSGQKIKSMTLLKDKSGKKKSIPKTSVKKSEHMKERQNVQNSDEKIMKKKLNFPSKMVDKDQKRKISRQSETPLASKSFKKHPVHHN